MKQEGAAPRETTKSNLFGLFSNEIAEAIKAVLGKDLKSVYDKSAETLPKQFSEGVSNGFLMGSAAAVVVKENEVLFEIDFTVNGCILLPACF